MLNFIEMLMSWIAESNNLEKEHFLRIYVIAVCHSIGFGRNELLKIDFTHEIFFNSELNLSERGTTIFVAMIIFYFLI